MKKFMPRVVELLSQGTEKIKNRGMELKHTESVISSVCCSCRGLGFGSQHLSQAGCNPVTTAPGDPTASLVSMGTGIPMHIHTPVHAPS